MSTHITDRIFAIRFPKEETGHYADRYLVAELGGDSNLRTNRGNRRCRSWSAVHIGMDWEVIAKCCRYSAGDCAGGMLKLKGRATTPECYIRAYRTAMKNAVSSAVAREMDGITVTARIRCIANKDDYHAKELVKAGRTSRTVTEYGETYNVFDFDLGNPTDLKLWLDHCHGYGWDCAVVHGPGEV
ncbi:MAG: hypothetical protein ABFC88_13180 [Thermoguttaceae bacterium]